MRERRRRRDERLLRHLAYCSMLFANYCAAFNLDDTAPIYKIGPPNSNFGFSVAEHIRGETPVVLVGAPKGETGQKNTNMAGALFSCPINTIYQGLIGENSWCERVNAEYSKKEMYDQTPDNTKLDSVSTGTWHYLGKDGQQLGASVASEGAPGGSAIVCAPHARFHNSSARLQGACYILDKNLMYTRTLMACNDKNLETQKRHNTYGACMQGSSSYIDKDIMLTGIVGARMWTGGVYARTNIHDNFEHPSEAYTMKQENNLRPRIPSHSYLGFSLTIGRFGFKSEKGQKKTIASGATRFEQIGAVVFMPIEMSKSADTDLAITNESLIIMGKSMGSAFGYALIATDLNGDKFDDLVVSAPYEHTNDKDGQFGGVVYVYFSNGVEAENDADVFRLPILLRQTGYFSQFGTSLAAIGNVDGDRANLNDFAVGAPYAFDGAGAVYIYHGTSDIENFRKKPVQVILGSALPKLPNGIPMKTFGFSLVGGRDLDGNSYPDVVVGAYRSNVVTILRARPVIAVSARHTTKSVYIEIQSSAECPSETAAATCFSMDLFLEIKGGKSKHAKYLVDYDHDVFTCNLEVLPFAPGIAQRGKILDSNQPYNKTWNCGKQLNQKPQKYPIKIGIPKSDIFDWIHPLKFAFNIRIKDEQKPQFPKQGENIVDLNKYPILNKFGSTYEFEIPFNTRCGDDHVCETDMILEALFSDYPENANVAQIKVGSKDSLDITFKIKNRGEKAYQAQLYLKYDSDELELPSLKSQQSKRLTLQTANEHTVLVNLGNPLEANSELEFNVEFKIMRGRTGGIGRPLSFEAILNSTSQELQPKDNSWNGTVKLIKETELELIGMSDPPIIYYGGNIQGTSAMIMEEDIGQMLRHNYTIMNRGPWSVSNITVKFLWPYQVASKQKVGKYALYLLEVPTMSSYNVNSRNVAVKKCTIERESLYVNKEQLALNTIYSTQISEQYVRRNKRSTSEEGSPEKASILDLLTDKSNRITPYTKEQNSEIVEYILVDCVNGTAKCFEVNCHFDFLDVGASSVIDFRARLWNSTFIEDYPNINHVELNSQGQIIIDKVQGIADDEFNNVAVISTLAYPDRPAIDDKGELTWWLILFSILIGLLILTIIIYICYKCGFFKRNRQPSLHTAQLQHEHEQWSEL